MFVVYSLVLQKDEDNPGEVSMTTWMRLNKIAEGNGPFLFDVVVEAVSGKFWTHRIQFDEQSSTTELMVRVSCLHAMCSCREACLK